jgi:hypothetical protein
MSPSAISTPVFAAQNSNILNDGSADSPRGFGSVTTAGTFNITATGPSLYRVVVATPAAPITAALPTTVKAGYRCRIEVELTGSTETNCFFTSPAIAEAQINGTGFVELMAKVDNPSVAGDWKVTDVEENCPAATSTATGANTNNITYQLSRKGTTAVFSASQSQATAIGTNSEIILGAAVPVRFRPSVNVVAHWPVTNNGNGLQTGFLDLETTGLFSARIIGSVAFSSVCAFSTNFGRAVCSYRI